jgi:voltage-gated potassium channel
MLKRILSYIGNIVRNAFTNKVVSRSVYWLLVYFSAIIMFILVLLSVFCLFVLPALAATKSIAVPTWGWVFIAFLYLQLWMLVAEFAYEYAAAFYGWKRRYLLPFASSNWKIIPGKVDIPSTIIVKMLQSYLYTVYGYGIAYVFLSNYATAAFNVPQLSLIDGVYFSLITASTVGYGDMFPITSLTRLLVMSEILISLIYGIFLFSVAAGMLKSRRM